LLGGFFLGSSPLEHHLAMSEITLPDHLSIDPKSPHYAPAFMDRTIRVHFNGKERFDVEEYCLGEGWIKVAAGKTKDRFGRPLLIKLKGELKVELV
jgi:Protein of unknown function (DUF3297)